MKILIDTNILISAFTFCGKPLKLIHRLLLTNRTLIVTSYVAGEFQETVERKWPTKANELCTRLLKSDFLFLESTDKQYGKLRDKKDVPVLSDAIHYNVDVILSGDKDFLDAGLEHPAVKSVSELWDFLGFDNL
ncbi:MAG: putative toxin-antitoxin system toxin component, PIN family [Oscillibacter sp.]|nr:putative toxin-antitoxin system toxin component, PIN family [Oscillibacter sp.]